MLCENLYQDILNNALLRFNIVIVRLIIYALVEYQMLIKCYPMRFLIIEVFKCVRGINPSYLNDMFIAPTSNYDFRNSSRLLQPKFNTYTFGYKSFRYFGSKVWNLLPAKLKKRITIYMHSERSCMTGASRTKLLKSWKCWIYKCTMTTLQVYLYIFVTIIPCRYLYLCAFYRFYALYRFCWYTAIFLLRYCCPIRYMQMLI